MTARETILKGQDCAKMVLLAVLPLLFYLCFAFSNCLAASTEYIVEDGDVLKIAVYDHDDLSTVVRVSGQGTIAFPLLNQVQVAGLTIPQVSEKISKALADGYIINPQVNVFIEEFRAQNVFVSGEVGQPGAIQFEIDMTLIKAITMAGGFKENAGKDEVEISRMIDGNKQTFYRAAPDYPVQPGDVIVVPQRLLQDIFITGEVTKPGVYPYEKGITVIKVISLAGGFTDIANKNKVAITRKGHNEKEVTLENVKLNEILQAGDVVIVPESFF